MATSKNTKKIAAKKTLPAKKKVVAKPVAKKSVAKNTPKAKVAPKKIAVAKKSKSPTKKEVQKKASNKTVATKKTPAKKVAPKKTVASKVISKKPALKKELAKKLPSKKVVAKKIEPKKLAPKKEVSKKVPEKKVVKPSAKPVAKKSEKPVVSAPEKKKLAAPEPKVAENTSKKSKKSTEAKKHTLSVAEAIAEILKSKKPKAQVAVEKPVVVNSSKQRACAGIYFSMDELDNYLATRDTSKVEEDVTVSKTSSKKKAEKTAARQTVQVPKRALAAASIADILGFNPIEQSRSAFEEKDVPTKWKKYYKLLVDMKDRIQKGSSDKVESVNTSNLQLSHENSTQGMDVADIGAKNSERDIAFNLLSNEQNIIAEVNAAIERIRNGTYGICEITGKQIPESRLMAVPFTRCTIEGQKQKEIEQRKLKAGQRKQQYDVDLSSDNQEPEVSEDDTE